MRPAGVICALGPNGRQAPLEEDSIELEAVEAFQDFLRIAPPPPLPHEVSSGQYHLRVGLERVVSWQWLCANDPQLRCYIAGGPWL